MQATYSQLVQKIILYMCVILSVYRQRGRKERGQKKEKKGEKEM